MAATLKNCLIALSAIFFMAAAAFAAGDAENRELAKWVSERPKLLKRFDANHNGKLDGAELEAARPVWKKKMAEKADRDDNPPGPKGGKGTNWENPPGPKGGPGASPNKKGKAKKK